MSDGEKQRISTDGRVEDKFKAIFDAYIKLESESYEFITRTTAMHNWLREAYRLWRENPNLNEEEMYQAWLPAFSQVYGHLFAPFLRRYRVMMSPIGEFARAQMESTTPKMPAETYFDLFRILGETQSRFMRAYSSNFQKCSQECVRFFSGDGQGVIDEVEELVPLRLMRDIADEEVLAYMETADQLVGYLGESQLMFPKTFYVHLQKLISAYPKTYRAAWKYESLFRQTWEQSLREFNTGIRQINNPSMEFEEFFDVFVRIFADEFDHLMRSQDFVEAQNSFIDITSDAIVSMRKVMEVQMDMFPALPFVTESEMDALAGRVHSIKRRTDAIQRNIREMDERFNLMASRHELSILERRMKEIEEKLSALPQRTELEGMEKKMEKRLKKLSRNGEEK